MLRKFIITLLFSLLILPAFGTFNELHAMEYKADYKYDYSSSKMYEVDYITDDGKFQKIDSFNDFDSAKAKMKENKDYVVRCMYGYSPSRIVAMNSGIVYSYPRGSSSIISIYEDWGDNKYKYASTYVERRYEMTYVDTPYMSSKAGFEGSGYCEVILNGFDGFADLEYTDLIPSKFIENGLPIYIGGPYSGNSIEAYAIKVIPNYYIVKTNGNYNDLEFHYHIAYPDSNGYASEYTIKVDNATNYDFLKKDNYYFSDDGCVFYSDYQKTNYVGTCINAYSFLPIRTKTNISGSTIDSFIKYIRDDYNKSVIYGHGDSFIQNGDEYGCNGALVFAMACQESAYGTSGYAVSRNNLFGWNAYDDSPDDASYFSSVDSCIREQMGRNLRQYCDYADSRYNGTYVGNKGSGFNVKYASDPYWGYKIGAIYYNLDKFSNNFNGKLTDYNAWDLGILTSNSVKIYSDADCTKQICISNNNNRLVTNIVSILDKNKTSYKIQFSNPISSGNVITDNDSVSGYSWSKSVAYVKCDDIYEFNNCKLNISTPEIINTSYKHHCAISNVSLSGSKLSLSGISAMVGLNMTNSSRIKHEIVAYNILDDKEITSFVCKNTSSNGFSLNDGYDYKYAGYQVDLDLTKLPVGSYYFKIRTTAENAKCESLIKCTNSKYRFFTSKSNKLTYKLNANYLYNYRFELDVMDTCLDYSTINKPSDKTSLVSFDKIKISDDGKLEVEGEAMIYYLNYNDPSKIEYSLYLVNSSNNYLKLNTSVRKSEVDYKKLLNSSYDLSNISFVATTDGLDSNLYDLNGNYCFILKIKNGNYIDIVEITNKSLKQFNTISNSKKKVKIETSNIRKRLEIKVEGR